jgi:hypothetical protein
MERVEHVRWANFGLLILEDSMPRLYEKQSGAFLGTVTDADIQSLVDQLEEEHQTDEDYFVDSATSDIRYEK